MKTDNENDTRHTGSEITSLGQAQKYTWSQSPFLNLATVENITQLNIANFQPLVKILFSSVDKNKLFF